MIRKNSLFYKLFRIKTTSKKFFDSFMVSFRPHSEECPTCHSIGSCKGKRDRMILILLFNSAIRASEILKDQVRINNQEIPEKIYPHMLRRTRASGLYRDGVPLEMIAAIFGHSSSETTKIYAISSVEQLCEALDKRQAEDTNTEKLWFGKDEEIHRLFGLN